MQINRNEMVSRTKASVQYAFCAVPAVSPKSCAISMVILTLGWKKTANVRRLVGSDLPPKTMATARVSPMARAMPNTTAVPNPAAAAGITALLIICQRVEPRAKLASRTLPGTARKASMETLITVGRIMATSTSVAAPQPYPPVTRPPVMGEDAFCKKGTSTMRPKKPITTEGIPVKISISGCKKVTTLLGPRSVKKTAVPIASGVTIITANAVVTTEPRIRPPAPKLTVPLLPVGSHFVLVKNVGAFTPSKKISNALEPINTITLSITAISRIAQKKKTSRATRSDMRDRCKCCCTNLLLLQSGRYAHSVTVERTQRTVANV